MGQSNNFRAGINDGKRKKYNPPREGTSKLKSAIIGGIILAALGGPVGAVIGAGVGAWAGDSNRQLKKKKSEVIKYKTGHKIGSKHRHKN